MFGPPSLRLPLVVLATVSCANVLGLGDFTADDGSGGTSTTTSSGDGSSRASGPASTTGSDATTTTATTVTTDGTSTTASDASSSTGGNCEQDSPCYTGPAGTENVGICHGGFTDCDLNGMFQQCGGELVPVAEDCATWQNDSCAPDCGEIAGLVKTYGGSSDDYPAASRITSNGELVLVIDHYAGATPLDFGNGPLDDGNLDGVFAIARIQTDGTVVWSDLHFFSPTNVSIGTSGNVLAHGYAQGAGMIGPLAVTGAEEVLVRLSGADGSVTQAVVAPPEVAAVDGNFVVNRNANGAYELRRYGNANLTTASATYAFGPGTLTIGGVRAFNNDRALVFGSFAGTVTIGGTTLTTTGTDGFVARFDNDTFSSVVQLGVTGGMGIGALTIDGANAFLGGGYNGSLPNPGNPGSPSVSLSNADPYLCRIGLAGSGLQPVWCRGYGTPAQNAGVRSIVVDGNANVFFVLGKGLGSLAQDGTLRWMRPLPDDTYGASALAIPTGILLTFAFGGMGLVDPFGDPQNVMGIGGDETGLATFVMP